MVHELIAHLQQTHSSRLAAGPCHDEQPYKQNNCIAGRQVMRCTVPELVGQSLCSALPAVTQPAGLCHLHCCHDYS